MNEQTTCVREVRRGGTWDSRWGKCGKPAKGTLKDGTPACGVHLRTERLADERKNASDEWTRRKGRVSEALGIWVGGYEVGEPVRVQLHELEELAKRRVMVVDTGKDARR